jgi:hypothetical protein
MRRSGSIATNTDPFPLDFCERNSQCSECEAMLSCLTKRLLLEQGDCMSSQSINFDFRHQIMRTPAVMACALSWPEMLPS